VGEFYTGAVGSISWRPTAGPRRASPRAGGGAITGVVASIKWGYYTAAGIHGYRVTRSKDGVWSLTATVVLHDAFKMAQTPLTFVAMHTKKGLDGKCVVKTEWRFSILSTSPIDPNTKQLTATLGPPEET
jgi:hypothetical protein